MAPDSAKPTEHAMEHVRQIIKYMYTNPNDGVPYHTYNIILNVHLEVLYLSAGRGRSHTGGYFFLGCLPSEEYHINLRVNITITCAILKIVTASTVESELGALFLSV